MTEFAWVPYEDDSPPAPYESREQGTDVTRDDVESAFRGYSDGRAQDIPLLRFNAGGVGVDIAIFDELGRRQKPLSPADGQPMQRLDRARVEALLGEDGDDDPRAVA